MSSPTQPSFSMFLKCLFGPRLYRIHDMAQTQGKNYQPKPLESFCDGLIKLFTFTLQMGAYTSPIILVYLLRRGNNFPNGFSFADSLRNVIKFSTGFVFALLSVYCLRGIGRVKNSDYIRFISNLTLQQASSSSSTIKRRYDFDFSQWTVDFKWNESSLADEKKPPLPMMTDSKTSDALVDRMIAVPCNFITHLIAHTVGRWMIYPGSVGILQALMAPALIDGRKLLIERRKGIRYKLLAQDNNEIDCMFIDRRDSDESFGKKLVICCEGNAGFYESGIVVTPVHTGYSTLGWNHPGFGGSSGLPFPAQEVAAIDVVVKFALDKLGFDEKDVLIMGWSIGGFTASWAAMTYPDVRGLILDATFDDIVPLALARTPSWWKPLTISTIRGYFDLNVSRHLENYPGPVLIIRRTEDEMIITRDDEPIGTNRANNLLVKLFQNRFPVLMKDQKVCDALTSWLSGGPDSQRLLTRMHWSDSDFALTLLKNFEQEKGSRLSYPIEIGDDLDTESKIKLIIFLASKHFKDFNSTHCTPLPPEMFSEPYDLLSSLRKMSNL